MTIIFKTLSAQNSNVKRANLQTGLIKRLRLKHLPANLRLKVGRWELLKSNDNEWQLYNIKKDLQKKHYLSKQMYREVSDLVDLYDHCLSIKMENR